VGTAGPLVERCFRTGHRHLRAGEREIATLRAHGRAQGWPMPQIVEAIVRFGVSRLKAHRLARGWTRPQAVEQILLTYDADGWPRPKLTCQRLCAWEHDPRVRPGEDYLDRLCRVYETRPDQLGYGRDYTPAIEPAGGEASAEPQAEYAGTSAASLVLAGEHGSADQDAQADSEETAASRWTSAAGCTGSPGSCRRCLGVPRSNWGTTPPPAPSCSPPGSWPSRSAITR
jgi:hypothetical protein